MPKHKMPIKNSPIDTPPLSLGPFISITESKEQLGILSLLCAYFELLAAEPD